MAFIRNFADFNLDDILINPADVAVDESNASSAEPDYENDFEDQSEFVGSPHGASLTPSKKGNAFTSPDASNTSEYYEADYHELSDQDEASEGSKNNDQNSSDKVVKIDNSDDLQSLHGSKGSNDAEVLPPPTTDSASSTGQFRDITRVDSDNIVTFASPPPQRAKSILVASPDLELASGNEGSAGGTSLQLQSPSSVRLGSSSSSSSSSSADAEAENNSSAKVPPVEQSKATNKKRSVTSVLPRAPVPVPKLETKASKAADYVDRISSYALPVKYIGISDASHAKMERGKPPSSSTTHSNVKVASSSEIKGVRSTCPGASERKPRAAVPAPKLKGRTDGGHADEDISGIVSRLVEQKMKEQFKALGLDELVKERALAKISRKAKLVPTAGSDLTKEMRATQNGSARVDVNASTRSLGDMSLRNSYDFTTITSAKVAPTCNDRNNHRRSDDNHLDSTCSTPPPPYAAAPDGTEQDESGFMPPRGVPTIISKTAACPVPASSLQGRNAEVYEQLSDRSESLYATFLADTIEVCKRRAAESTSIYDITMHRKLAEHLLKHFSTSDDVRACRQGMVDSAYECYHRTGIEPTDDRVDNSCNDEESCSRASGDDGSISGASTNSSNAASQSSFPVAA